MGKSLANPGKVDYNWEALNPQGYTAPGKMRGNWCRIRRRGQEITIHLMERGYYWENLADQGEGGAGTGSLVKEETIVWSDG